MFNYYFHYLLFGKSVLSLVRLSTGTPDHGTKPPMPPSGLSQTTFEHNALRRVDFTAKFDRWPQWNVTYMHSCSSPCTKQAQHAKKHHQGAAAGKNEPKQKKLFC